jgi:hypothetical protein
MIDLTEEQEKELTAPLPIAVDRRTGQEYVLIRKERYERLKGLLYEGSALEVQETYPLADEVAAKAGWDDPTMDVYNRFIPRDPA